MKYFSCTVAQVMLFSLSFDVDLFIEMNVSHSALKNLR